MVTTKGTRRLYQRFTLRNCDELTVMLGGLSEGLTDAEHDPRKYVLETRYQEESRVLRIPDVGLLGVQLWRNKP